MIMGMLFKPFKPAIQVCRTSPTLKPDNSPARDDEELTLSLSLSSKTPEGWSATFRVHFFSFFILFDL